VYIIRAFELKGKRDAHHNCCDNVAMTTLILLALALSADAFAAALTQGAISQPRAGLRVALWVGFAYGLAQGLMPLLGWGLGLVFVSIIRDIDHWIAFALLAAIGAHMLRQGLKNEPRLPAAAPSVLGWRILPTAIATSIDAAAAGVTLPLLNLPIVISCLVIGAVTCAVSFAGVMIGAAASARAGKRAEVAGGIVLIMIGTKILIEHLFFDG
jgi:putative Mn2+ efflux pump MntP